MVAEVADQERVVEVVDDADVGPRERLHRPRPKGLSDDDIDTVRERAEAAPTPVGRLEHLEVAERLSRRGRHDEGDFEAVR